jgi:HAD superfamily hydrolase (TIGR01509 family)
VSPRVTISKRDFDAVIFDTDGVITRTAVVHEAAWKRLFDAYLLDRAARTGEPFQLFTEDDYRQYVDGRPRYDGVFTFLQSRGLSLPYGDPSDSPDKETVCGLGNRKDEYFLQHIREHGVEAYPSTVAFIRALRAAGVKTGVFSASRNVVAVLEAAGAADLFDARVDGIVAEELGLPGKPDPATLLETARRLGAAPERTAIVEDAIAGVEAGHAGGFRLVIGVNRSEEAGALLANGATVEVADLREVAVADA